MSEQTTTAGTLWGKAMPRGPIELIIALTTIAAWAALFVVTKGRLLQTTVWTVPFLILIAAVSTPWRTVSFGQIGTFFMLGMGPVFLLVILAGSVLDGSFVEDWVKSGLEALDDAGNGLRVTNLGRDIWAPLTEEFFKVLPLLALFWWRRSGLRTLSSPLDFAVLGGATGAGMGFSEDILVFLHQGLPAPTSAASALGLGQYYHSLVGADASSFSPTGTSGFVDRGSFFFPEMQSLFGVVWSGHGALAMGLGLSIGLAWWGARRYRTRLFYLAPAFTYLWVVWEHMMANWYGGAACGRTSSPLCTIAAVDLRGRIFPVVLLAALIYAVSLSRSVILGHREADPALLLSRSDVDRSAYQADGVRGSARYIRDRFEFGRWRRKAAYGGFHLEHARKPKAYHALAILSSRGRALALSVRLQGDPPTPIPKETLRVLDRATPLG